MEAEEMKVYWSTIAFVGCLILLLTACNPIAIQPDDTMPSPAATLPVVEIQARSITSLPTKEPEQVSTQMTQPTTPLFSSGSESLIEKAKQDLAQRLEVSVDSITVVAVIGQEFSTNAFYCRTTKERIAKEESPQVISGQSILLSASGRRYEYHASDQTVFFCRPLP
jgi:hypothetical protein